MEFYCPNCQTMLRVAGEHQNPKVRCRACGTIFRPLDAGDTRQPVPPQAAAQPPVNPFQTAAPPAAASVGSAPPVTQDDWGPVTPSRSEATAPPTPPASRAPASPGPVISPRSSKGGKGSGWGILFFIALMVLSRAPRLMRNFQRDPPPAPVEIDDGVLRQLEKEFHREPLRDADDEGPILPNGVKLDELENAVDEVESDAAAP